MCRAGLITLIFSPEAASAQQVRLVQGYRVVTQAQAHQPQRSLGCSVQGKHNRAVEVLSDVLTAIARKVKISRWE